MRSRGVSPLLASVFLVGLAIIIGVVVMMFGKGVAEREIDITQQALDRPLVVRFNAEWKDVNGTPEAILCSSDPDDDASYYLLIENIESSDISYIVKTTSDLGMDVCGPFKIEAYNSKLVYVTYNEAVVGRPNGLEVIADITAVQ